MFSETRCFPGDQHIPSATKQSLIALTNQPINTTNKTRQHSSDQPDDKAFNTNKMKRNLFSTRKASQTSQKSDSTLVGAEEESASEQGAVNPVYIGDVDDQSISDYTPSPHGSTAGDIELRDFEVEVPGDDANMHSRRGRAARFAGEGTGDDETSTAFTEDAMDPEVEPLTANQR